MSKINPGHFSPISISGYFVEDENPEEDEDGEEDDFEESEVLEDGGGDSIKRDKNCTRTKIFVIRKLNKEEIEGKEITITGPFALTGPRWCAEMEAQHVKTYSNTSRYKYVRNLHYTLVDSSQSVYSLLVDCKVHEQHVQSFKDWLTLSGNVKNLKLSTLKLLLDQFANCENADLRSCAEQIIRHIRNEMQLIEIAIKFPELLYHLPAIFKNHYFNLLTKDAEKEGSKMLSELKNILETAPYMFGFRQMMTKRGISISGAPVDVLKHCSFFRKIKPEIRAALYTYDIIKNCCNEGHTYILENQLFNTDWSHENSYHNIQQKIKKYRESIKTYWTKVQEFFQKNEKILKFRKVNNVLQIHYHYYLFCEKRVAEQLLELMTQSNPMILNHDMKKSDVDTFGGDECQIRAAEQIRTKPVVILSGAGGCGKTHVLCEVFKEHVAIEECVRETEARREADARREAEARKQAEAEMEAENRKQANERGKASINADKNLEACKETNNVDGYLLNATKPSENDAKKQAEIENESIEKQNSSNEEFAVTEKPNTEKDSNTKSQNPVFFKSVKKEILLTAPTGKAATILRKRTSLPSSTLHKIQYSYSAFKRARYESDDKINEEKKRWKYADIRILVVDESSMVDLSVFSQVLNALLIESDLQKVIFLGDIHQLPSIGAGNLFKDLYTARLDANPIIPHVELTNNHRAESRAIVENALLIRKKQMPVFDGERFVFVDVKHTRDLKKGTEREFDEFLQSTNDPTLKDHQRSQVISFTNDYCKRLNDLCCLYYSKHNSQNGFNFQVGDKICCTKNCKVIDLELKESSQKREKLQNNQEPKDPEKGETSKVVEKLQNDEEPEREETGVEMSNGEVFFIKKITVIQEKGKQTTRWLLSEGVDKHGDEETIEVLARSMCKQARAKHAWARTIHTFQGSEAETIVYVVSPCKYLNWQHIYTAVTRGRSKVYIVGTMGALQAAIMSDPRPRQTYLQTLLKQEWMSMKQDWNADQNNSYLTCSITTPLPMLNKALASGLGSSNSPNPARPLNGSENNSFAESILQNQMPKTPSKTEFSRNEGTMTLLENPSISENNASKTAMKRTSDQDVSISDELLGTPSKKSCTVLDDFRIKRSPRASFQLYKDTSQTPPGHS